MSQGLASVNYDSEMLDVLDRILVEVKKTTKLLEEEADARKELARLIGEEQVARRAAKLK